MNRTYLLLTCVVSLVVFAAASGCTGGRRRGTPGPATDAGPQDLGGIVIDLGTGVDFGTGTDLGHATDLGYAVDLGHAVDLGSSCTPTVVDYITASYCSAATDTCVQGCGTDGACQWSCLDADPNASCSVCVQQNLIACANANGCVSQWDVFDCCVTANCPTGSATTCVMTYCGSEQTSFTTCMNDVLPTATCTAGYPECF